MTDRPSEPDRLAEIKGWLEYMVPSDDGFDEIDWLISEVERLRAAVVSLLESEET